MQIDRYPNSTDCSSRSSSTDILYLIEQDICYDNGLSISVSKHSVLLSSYSSDNCSGSPSFSTNFTGNTCFGIISDGYSVGYQLGTWSGANTLKNQLILSKFISIVFGILSIGIWYLETYQLMQSKFISIAQNCIV